MAFCLLTSCCSRAIVFSSLSFSCPHFSSRRRALYRLTRRSLLLPSIPRLKIIQYSHPPPPVPRTPPPAQSRILHPPPCVVGTVIIIELLVMRSRQERSNEKSEKTTTGDE